jgi:hypothetical protein
MEAEDHLFRRFRYGWGAERLWAPDKLLDEGRAAMDGFP